MNKRLVKVDVKLYESLQFHNPRVYEPTHIPHNSY